MTLKEAKDRYIQVATTLDELKKTIEAEKRTATDEEKKTSITLLNEMDQLDRDVERLEWEERVDTSIQKAKESRQRIVKPSPLNITGEKKGFRTFGEYLQAVYTAGVSPRVDARLTYQPIEMRAATGMSEGIPADGGLGNARSPL